MSLRSTKAWRRWFSGLMLPLMVMTSACEQQSNEPLPAIGLVVAQPCDVRSGCVAEAEDFAVALSMGPEVRALTPFPVNVEHRRGPEIDSMTVAFDMADMDMGSNRYRLIGSDGGAWHASVTLPVCMSGRSDWLADFEIVAADRRYRFQVPFVLEKG
jgi:hypothetical protein